MSNPLTITMACSPASKVVREGDAFALTITVSNPSTESAAAKQFQLRLDGPFAFDGYRHTGAAQLEIAGVYPSVKAPDWTLVDTAAPHVVTKGNAGAWTLSEAISRNVYPNRIWLPVGPAPGETWTFTYRCRALGGGTMGKVTVSASAVGSSDPVLLQNEPKVATLDLLIARNAAIPTLTAPGTPNLTSNVFGQVVIGWTLNSTGESGVRLHRSTNAGLTFPLVADLPPGTTSYADTDVANATPVQYKVSVFSRTAESALTSALSVSPASGTLPLEGVVTNVGATAYGTNAVLLTWPTAAVTAGMRYRILRSAISSSDTAALVIGSTYSSVFSFVDRTVQPGATYWYSVYSYPWEPSSTATPTTGSIATRYTRQITIPAAPPERSAVATKYCDPGARYSKLQVARKTMLFSSRNRPKTFVNNCFFDSGLKRYRDMITVTASTDTPSGILSGIWTVYIVYFDSRRNVRSIPSVGVVSPDIGTGRIGVALPTVAGKIPMRDTACDVTGAAVDACDFWEVYITGADLNRAYRVAQVPITEQTYTTDEELQATDLTNGTYRPMELGFQSLIWPAVGVACYKDNHIYGTYEETVFPTVAGATLSFTNGSAIVTTTNFVCDDNLYQKQIALNGKLNGYVVWDVISSSSFEIRKPTDATATSGGTNWDQPTANFLDFSFQPVAGRLWTSAYFIGEAGNQPSFSPETIDPTNVIEGELDPDDSEVPNGIIASRDVLFISKPTKSFYCRGGSQPGIDFFSDLAISPVSRAMGVLAPKTLCLDPDDQVYFLGSSGVCIMRESGIDPVGTRIGTGRTFEQIFEIERATNAVGVFFPREHSFICCGLDADGASGGRDGLIYDARSRQLTRFATKRRVTVLEVIADDNGEPQVVFGDESGMVGILFPRGLYADDVDANRADPYSAEVVVSSVVTSAPLLPPQQLQVGDGRGGTFTKYGYGELQLSAIDPVFRAYGDDEASLTVEIAALGRMGRYESPTFDAVAPITLTTGESPGIARLEGHWSQALQVRMTLTGDRATRAEWTALDGVMALRGGTQVQ